MEIATGFRVIGIQSFRSVFILHAKTPSALVNRTNSHPSDSQTPSTLSLHWWTGRIRIPRTLRHQVRSIYIFIIHTHNQHHWLVLLYCAGHFYWSFWQLDQTRLFLSPCFLIASSPNTTPVSVFLVHLREMEHCFYTDSPLQHCHKLFNSFPESLWQVTLLKNTQARTIWLCKKQISGMWIIFIPMSILCRCCCWCQ